MFPHLVLTNCLTLVLHYFLHSKCHSLYLRLSVIWHQMTVLTLLISTFTDFHIQPYRATPFLYVCSMLSHLSVFALVFLSAWMIHCPISVCSISSQSLRPWLNTMSLTKSSLITWNIGVNVFFIFFLWCF